MSINLSLYYQIYKVLKLTSYDTVNYLQYNTVLCNNSEAVFSLI